MDVSDETPDGGFLAELCAYRDSIRLVFVLSLTFLVLSVPLYFLAGPGTASRAISAINVLLFGGFAVVARAVLAGCQRAHPE